MLTSKCTHCIHNAGMKNYTSLSDNSNIDLPACCNRCIHIATDNFQSKEKYYPLELSGSHIHLWNESGKSKITIAYFTNLESDEGSDLIFVGERPLDPRVNWVAFRNLIKIGYENHKTESC